MAVKELETLKGFVDSHFHLTEMAARGMDVPALLQELFQRGFAGGLDLGGREDELSSRAALSAPFPSIGLAVGLPPSSVSGDWEDQLSEVERQCQHPRVMALGEIGIDLYRLPHHKEEQIALFEAQIGLANRLNLPIVVHCRDAEKEVLAVLQRSRPERGGIIHCFSGDYEAGKNFIDLGLFLSFAGNLTYPRNSSLQEGAARFPRDHLLAETDSPYLTPQALRGKLNHPGNIVFTLEFLARLQNLDVEELSSQVRENFSRLFPLIPLEEG